MTDMIKIILIDDERPALRELEYMLNGIYDISVLGSFVNPIHGIESINELKPDAVFLDINMPQLKGTEAAKVILDRFPGTNIVFITAYDQYAIKAFELNALDYLLKPISRERLEKMLDRLREKINGRQEGKDIVSSHTLLINRLGKFEICFENQAPVKWHSKKAEELIAFLLHNKDNPLGRDEIITALWPCIDTLKATKYLDENVYYIRKSLLEYGIGAEQINIDNDYCLSLSDVTLDTDCFSKCFERAREVGAVKDYEACIKHYTGKYLEDSGWSWAEEVRDNLNRQYISIVFNLVKFRIISEENLTAEEGDNIMQLSEEMIFQYLSRASLKYGNKGFLYCASAIKLASENPQLIIKMEDLYEKVGELYGENAKNVSRTIRYSLTHLNITNKEFLSKALYEVQFSINH